MSRVKTLIKEMDDVRQEVLAITGIAEEELSEWIYEAALKCLKDILGSDEYGINELPKRPEFWGWWKAQWYRRDRMFLDRLKFNPSLLKYQILIPGTGTETYLHDQKHIRMAYELYHKVDRDNVYFNNGAIEYSYHQLIKCIGKSK